MLKETGLLETIVKVYAKLTEVTLILGVPESTAKFVPALVLILLALFLVKLIQGDSKPNSKKGGTKTALRGKTALSLVPGKAGEEPLSGRFGMRQFSRVDVNLKTFYTLPDDNNPKSCELVDVSLTGLAFVCPQKIQRGTRVRLQLPVLDKGAPDKDFTVSGEVLRIKPLDKLEKQIEHGLRFFHLMKKESDYMELIIQKFK